MMVALDTNIITRFWYGEPDIVRRIAALPASDLSIPSSFSKKSC